ncbi:MAG: hypothetical protein ABSG99_02520 [Sedimentisphaerales bacterium]
MLALTMNGTYGAKGHWADKIAFFGLFIAVLLIACFIVLWKSAIVLSEPIELDCAGLSVCIPTGAGWKNEKQWKYQQNAFTLDSFFTPGSGSVTTIVSCRYLLAATKAAPDKLFEERVSTVGGSKIAKTGQIEIGRQGFSFAKDSQNGSILTLDWAHIKSSPSGSQGSKTLFDTFFGIAQLPNNRRLDIEVYQTTGDTNLAEGIFKSVVESLKFTDNRLLETGSKIVAEIKGKGLDSFLVPAGNKQEEGQESFFLIKDARGHTIGFTMEVLGSHSAEILQTGGTLEPTPETRLNILVGSFYYIRGRYEQATFFQSDNRFDEFVWRSETSSPADRSGAEIISGKDGIITVKEFGRRVEEKIYQINPAAIPDVLSEFTFSQMLDSDRKEIFVDIIGADGKITPALVSRIEAPRPFTPTAPEEQNSGGSGAEVTREEAACVFRVELMDGRGFSEQVYLDDQRRISRILLQQESTYTLERTSTENILREFPEQGGYILQRKDKILEQNQLQESSE